MRYIYRLTALVLAMAAPAIAGEFELIQTDDGVTVQLGNQLFTRYLTESGPKPILWPIVGPTGVEMTRAFPMRSGSEGASTDHVHQRSLWFGHGDVNGVNFWLEERPFGTIRHDAFLKVVNSPIPTIITRNSWISDKDEKICTDYRAIQFGADNVKRWIDFDITIVNDTDKPVTFGDTKEGCFALRVADSMRAERKSTGRIVNADEAVNKDAWGKTAAWVDYQGPDAKEGALVGLAVLNHPASFRFPTYWHVRTYGLFAANVFGVHNFRNSHEEDGSATIEPGDSISFYYRVVVHQGDERDARIPGAFVDYAKLVKAPVPEILEADSVEEAPASDSEIVALEKEPIAPKAPKGDPKEDAAPQPEKDGEFASPKGGQKVSGFVIHSPDGDRA